MKTKDNIGEQYIKELRETLLTESKKLKWHRRSIDQRYATTNLTAQRVADAGVNSYMSKKFILKRYLGLDDES